MSTEAISTLTDREYWEEYWEDGPNEIPEEVTINPNKYSEGLYSVFRRYLANDKPLAVVEIGGAPGLFLTSLTKLHDNLSLGVIDYSDRGVAATHGVSKKFGLDINVHQKDLYKDDLSDLPDYDIVYSLGVVEHYQDVERSVDRHLECIKEGGIAIIGLPVFLGINQWLVNRLAPKNKSTWYPFIMDDRSWRSLYERDDLEVIADEYVGGFNPHVHHRLEDKQSLYKKLIYVFLHKYFAKLWDLIPGTQKLNSRYFSFFYYIVVKKLPVKAETT